MPQGFYNGIEQRAKSKEHGAKILTLCSMPYALCSNGVAGKALSADTSLPYKFLSAVLGNQ
jgi:uncharacterized phosphosugar-binding protein